jgi:hypothetical protein
VSFEEHLLKGKIKVRVVGFKIYKEHACTS